MIYKGDKMFHPLGKTKGIEKISGCAGPKNENKNYEPTHRKPKKGPNR